MNRHLCDRQPLQPMELALRGLALHAAPFAADRLPRMANSCGDKAHEVIRLLALVAATRCGRETQDALRRWRNPRAQRNLAATREIQRVKGDFNLVGR